MSSYSKTAMYNYIANAVTTAHSGAYCSAVYEPVPESFPAVYITEVNHYDVRKGLDLCRTDSQWKSVFEVQIFSNKGNKRMSEAESILATVRDAFKTQMYIEEFEQTVPNIDTKIYRIVAEFSRTVGSGDQMI